MEILESGLWIVLGFIPTLCAMELAWRIRGQRIIKPYTQKVAQA